MGLLPYLNWPYPDMCEIKPIEQTCLSKCNFWHVQASVSAILLWCSLVYMTQLLLPATDNYLWYQFEIKFNKRHVDLWELLHKVMKQLMMTSSAGNIFRVTEVLCEEFTGHRWTVRLKASNAELWYFLWSVAEPTVEQKMETPVIWDDIPLIMTSL